MRGAQGGARLLIAAAADHPLLPAIGAPGIGRRTIFMVLRIVVVITPFVDIAGHVPHAVETEAVRPLIDGVVVPIWLLALQRSPSVKRVPQG